MISSTPSPTMIAMNEKPALLILEERKEESRKEESRKEESGGFSYSQAQKCPVAPGVNAK